MERGEAPAADEFELVFNGVFLTCVCLLGLVGNVFCLVLLSRPNMRSPINCCLQWLALFDSGVLLTAFFFIALRTLARWRDGWSYYTWIVFPFLAPALYTLALISQTGSVWSTVVVTLERYVAVCLPLRAKSLCTCSRAMKLNFTILLIAIGYNSPRFWEVAKVSFVDTRTNGTFYRLEPSPLRVNKVYFEVYHVWMYLTLMYFLPFLILAILNAAIWLTVHRSSFSYSSISFI